MPPLAVIRGWVLELRREKLQLLIFARRERLS
jgi:hypothetical protein